MQTLNIVLVDKHAEKSLKACSKELEQIDAYINDNIVNIKGVEFSPKNTRLDSMRELSDNIESERLKALFDKRQSGTAKRLINVFLKEQKTDA